MATPHVAGVVAILWGRVPALVGRVAETEAILAASARPKADASCGAGNVYGAGIVDVAAALRLALPPSFVRGRDCAQDAHLDITDPVRLLGFLFTGGPAPSCADACDAGDDGRLDVSDGIAMLAFLFLGGPAPAAPFPGCGADPAADGLGCGASSCQ